MKKLFTILLLISQIHAYSQCLTDHYHKEAIKKNPQILETEKAFFESVQQVDNNKRATKYIIPVVFHVIHTNGTENISKAQIENQIKILNEDFSLTNPNKTAIRTVFKNIAADCEIEFRLAKIDPQGNCTEGINRVYSPLHVNADDEAKTIPGAYWPSSKYLNIWTVSSIYSMGAVGTTTLGYATFPWYASSNPTTDGVICRADHIGVIGTGDVSSGGRVLTHEVGHYLGLFHTFTDECNGTGSNGGDRCGDTPPVAGSQTNANCPFNGNSCSQDVPNLVDQWENYMDYTKGSCQAMFSLNQKSIMHAVLTNSQGSTSSRKNMVSAANLLATGVNDGNTSPLAFFYSSARTVCVGQAVSFYDVSCKANVVSRQWMFTGANITSTNKDTPVVVYNTPGKYKVTLIATNSFGSNTLAVDNYITVIPAVAFEKSSVSQNFENSGWNNGTGWSIVDQGLKFTRETTTAYAGTACLVAPINTNVPAGQRFQLITPSIDMRSLAGKSPKISMMVGYVRQNDQSSEELRIYYSRGCENSWNQFLYRSAGFISYSNTAYAVDFKPTSASEWKMISFGLSSFETDSNVAFMVEVVSGAGNSVYIDNINIGQFNTGIYDTEKAIALDVFPNPSTGELNIDYINANGETEVWLENIEGKRIATILEKNLQTGEISIKWNSQNTIPTGIYILKIKSNEQVINKKVIFAN